MSRALAPADVVVAGGGLAAVAVALELARRDLLVDLLAEGRAGEPAGPGGPVAAQASAEGMPEPVADLALLARHLFSDWISALEEETGVPCEYDERGAMAVALDEAEEVALDRALDVQRARGLHFEVLEAEEARGREPALAASLHAAFAFARDGVARARRVGKALALAARAAGVRVHEGARAEGVAMSGGRVAGAKTALGTLPAEAVVLAQRGGAGGVSGAPCLTLAAAERAWLKLDATADPDRPVRLLSSRGAFVVPRRDGSVLVLDRSQPPGAGREPTAGRAGALLAELARLVPASGEWRVAGAGSSREHSAPDRRPLLGEASIAGLYVATGWAGDELLLAPAAAAVVADLVTGRTPPLAAAPFAPERFGA